MGPYRTPGPPLRPLPNAPSDRGAAMIAIAGLVLIAIAIWAGRREPDPLAELPADERALLLERTLENLELCTRHREPELRGFCESQAVIARALPECDAHCRELARSRYPSRVPSALP